MNYEVKRIIMFYFLMPFICRLIRDNLLIFNYSCFDIETNDILVVLKYPNGEKTCSAWEYLVQYSVHTAKKISKLYHYFPTTYYSSTVIRYKIAVIAE